MDIDREQLLIAMRVRGHAESAARVDRELPRRIDTEEYADLLRELGVTARELNDLAAMSRSLAVPRP